MNTHSICRPLSPSEEDAFLAPVEKAAVLDSHQATQLDVCRCPKCAGPMTARIGAYGPYFHCLCAAPPQPRPFTGPDAARGLEMPQSPGPIIKGGPEQNAWPTPIKCFIVT